MAIVSAVVSIDDSRRLSDVGALFRLGTLANPYRSVWYQIALTVVAH